MKPFLLKSIIKNHNNTHIDITAKYYAVLENSAFCKHINTTLKNLSKETTNHIFDQTHRQSSEDE